MKACNKKVGGLLMFLTLPALAENTSCFNNEDNSCFFSMRENDNEAYIFTSKNNKPIFSQPEIESTMENLSFYRNNDSYTLIKESSDSSKSKELMMFNEKFHPLKYLYLTTDINIKTNERYWHGIYCSVDNPSLIAAISTPLQWSFKEACNGYNESESKYKYIGDDLFFSVDLIINGTRKKMDLVALDSKNNDNVNINNFGCISNCPKIEKKINLTGKINNKYIIKMKLEVDNEIISGYYFYDKSRINISLKGIVRDGEINLHTDNKKNETTEKFIGKINDGTIIGQWINIESGKNYPFNLYTSLN